MSLTKAFLKNVDRVVAPFPVMDEEGGDAYAGYFMRGITSPASMVPSICGLFAAAVTAAVGNTDMGMAVAGGAAVNWIAYSMCQLEHQSVEPLLYIDRTVKPVNPQLSPQIEHAMRYARGEGAAQLAFFVAMYSIGAYCLYTGLSKLPPQEPLTESGKWVGGFISGAGGSYVLSTLYNAFSHAWRAHRVLTHEWTVLEGRPEPRREEASDVDRVVQAQLVPVPTR